MKLLLLKQKNPLKSKCVSSKKKKKPHNLSVIKITKGLWEGIMGFLPLEFIYLISDWCCNLPFWANVGGLSLPVNKDVCDSTPFLLSRTFLWILSPLRLVNQDRGQIGCSTSVRGRELITRGLPCFKLEMESTGSLESLKGDAAHQMRFLGTKCNFWNGELTVLLN